MKPTPGQEMNMLRSIAKVRLYALCQCHAAYGAQRDKLQAKLADLTRRIRLARKDLPAVGLDDGGAFDRCVAALDLRKPLSRRTKSAACPESSLVAWGEHLLSRRTRRKP